MSYCYGRSDRQRRKADDKKEREDSSFLRVKWPKFGNFTLKNLRKKAPLGYRERERENFVEHRSRWRLFIFISSPYSLSFESSFFILFSYITPWQAINILQKFAVIIDLKKKDVFDFFFLRLSETIKKAQCCRGM